MTSRIAFPSNVPAWVQNKEKTEALYNLALRQESKRLSAKDENDARVAANDEMRKNREGFKKRWSAYVKNMKERVDRCRLYTSPSPRDQRGSRMLSSA